MAAPSGERPRVIRRKIIVPDTPVGAAPRERLDGLFCQLVDAHRVVAVAATAGAGKSVAVAHAPSPSTARSTTVRERAGRASGVGSACR